ncbi:hypothetical protein [Paenibacillus odorifer]|nr:hypothetical protein [Paenibacillus odorifer]
MSDDDINKMILEASKKELTSLVEVAKSACMHALKEAITNHLELIEN